MLRFADDLLSGRKIWTSRNKKYGVTGDTFEIFNREFSIQDVRRMTLDEVSYNYEDEGCKTRDEFIQVWKKIHPRKGWIPEQKVWVHVFKKKG